MLFPFTFLQSQIDPSYQAVLNYATSLGYALPSSGQQVKQNKLVVDLKTAGIWNKLDTFAVFANDGGSNFGLIDWKRLTLYTAFNSPTFTTNRGFQGNGTSSYIASNYLPITNAVNLSQNSNSHGYVISIYDSAPTNAEQHWGNATNISAQGFWRRVNSGNTYNNGTTILSITKTYPINVLIHMDRPDSTTVYDITDGTVRNTVSSTSAAVLNNQFLSLIYPNSPQYSDAQMQIVFAGASTYNERVAFNIAVKTYLTSL